LQLQIGHMGGQCKLLVDLNLTESMYALPTNTRQCNP
jgi:hypothetical protein